MKALILIVSLGLLPSTFASANGLDWFANRSENMAKCAEKELKDDLRDDDNDHISDKQKRRLLRDMDKVVKYFSNYADSLRREVDDKDVRNKLREAIRKFHKRFNKYDVDDGWKFDYCWDEVKQRAHKNPDQLPSW